MRNKIVSKKTREKMRIAQIGRRHSEETKEKIRTSIKITKSKK